VTGHVLDMTEQREPTQDDVEDESPEFSPTPPEGQQEKSHENEDTLSPDEKSSG
jgi:hypothetical protein